MNGTGVLAGLAVKAFAFGVRYTSFSDMANIGAQIGLRFSSFSIE